MTAVQIPAGSSPSLRAYDTAAAAPGWWRWQTPGGHRQEDQKPDGAPALHVSLSDPRRQSIEAENPENAPLNPPSRAAASPCMTTRASRSGDDRPRRGPSGVTGRQQPDDQDRRQVEGQRSQRGKGQSLMNLQDCRQHRRGRR